MESAENREEVLFREARQRAVGPEREAYLDQACRGNEALRRRLAALLRADELPAPFLEPEASQWRGEKLRRPADDLAVEEAGAWIGRYKLLERMGEGGFGVVYLAEQLEPLRRQVALKIIKRGMDTKQVIARFEAERQALALMDHPNIAKVFDAGATETGRPYFVMELVRGIAVTKYCDQEKLGTAERLDLFTKVCHAIQHAHQKGIIHRDIKPSNILVTLQDGVPVPKVIDFGIAKATQPELTKKTVYTQFQHFIGTPAYMSPEQAEMSGLDIDTRSDIYSLGVLLYELLTGSTPFDTKELVQAGLDEMRKIIGQRQPLRPSTRLRQTAIAASRSPLAPRPSPLAADLDWIVMKCLEKDRARRYASANLLALDVNHYLLHEPVLASPPSRLYQAGKFIRRHRPAVLAGVVVLCGLMLGTTGALLGLAKASRERNRAQAMLHQMDLKHAQELFESDHAAEGLASLALLVRERPTDLPAAEWLLNEMTQRSFPLPLREPIQHDDHVLSARFSPDGRRILTVSRNNTARVWDAATGRPLTPPLAHNPSLVRKNEFLGGLHPMFAAFSPDGSRVATGATDNLARIWDADTGRMLTPPLPHPNWVSYVSFSPDGKWVATACKDGAVRLWNAATGEPVGKPFQHATWANFVEFSPSGDRILTGADDNTGQVWEVASGARLGQPLRHEGEVRHGEFSPDGTRVVTASGDLTARIWSAHTGEPLSPPMKHDHFVCTARFSPDGGRVVTASFDKTARLWDGFSGEPVGKPMRHKAPVRNARFSPGGQLLVTASEDGTARIWDAVTGDPVSEPMIHHGTVWSAEFDPAGKRILTASADATAQIWDARPGQALHNSFPTSGACRQALWSPDGRKILTTSGSTWLWDASERGQLTSPGNYLDDPESLFARFSDDGRSFVIASGDGAARVWATDCARPEHPPLIGQGARIWPASSMPVRTRPLRHHGRVHYAEFSADNARVVTASADGTAQVWSAATGAPQGPPLKHRDIVFMACFSPSGREVLTASADGTACLWDARTGQLLRPPLAHPGQVTAVCFRPEGRFAASVCKDLAARVWDLSSGAVVAAVRHLEAINGAAFSPDGQWLLTASDDKTARVWEARTGRPVSPPLAHDGHVLGAEFSADGQRVLTASEDGTARLWDARTGQCISEPFRHASRVTTAHLHPQGNQVLTASLDNSARIWEIVRVSKPAPPWLPALAEGVAGQRLNAQRQLEPVRSSAWLEWRERLSQSPARDEYSRWARWFCGDRAARTAAPSATNTTAQFVARLWEWGYNQPKAAQRLRESFEFGRTDPGTLLERLLRWSGTQTITDRRGVAELEWLGRKELFEPKDASLAKALVWARRGDAQKVAACLDEAERAAGRTRYAYGFFAHRALLIVGRAEAAAQALAKSIEEAEAGGGSPWADTLRWRRSGALLSAGRRSEAQLEWLKASRVLPRPGNASSNLVDLTPFYSGALGGWLSLDSYQVGLHDLPQGIVQVGGTTFDLRALVQLSSPGLVAARQDFAEQCSGIPVNQRCHRLHFLHATDLAEQDGVKVGAYRLHYVDGQDHEIPIIYGQDLLVWLDDSGAPNTPTPAPVWQVTKPPGITLRLFRTTWTNPRPDLELKTLDFISAMSKAGPFLVALTADP